MARKNKIRKVSNYEIGHKFVLNEMMVGSHHALLRCSNCNEITAGTAGEVCEVGVLKCRKCGALLYPEDRIPTMNDREYARFCATVPHKYEDVKVKKTPNKNIGKELKGILVIAVIVGIISWFYREQLTEIFLNIFHYFV